MCPFLAGCSRPSGLPFMGLSQDLVALPHNGKCPRLPELPEPQPTEGPCIHNWPSVREGPRATGKI